MADIPLVTYATDSGGSPLAEVPWVVIPCTAINPILDSNISGGADGDPWVVTNGTAPAGAPGFNGRPNTACLFTATSNNATLMRLSAYTIASGNHYVKVWLRRASGTGTVDVTYNNGGSWTNVSSQLNTTSYTPVIVPALAVSNPHLGLRLGTSGDAVHVGNVELHPNRSSMAYIVGLPPMVSGTTEFTFGTPTNYISLTGNHGDSGAYVIDFKPYHDADDLTDNINLITVNGAQGLLYYDYASKTFRSYDGTNTASSAVVDFTAGSTYRVAVAFGGTSMRVCVNGTWGDLATYTGAYPTVSNLAVGHSTPYTLRLRNVQFWAGSYDTAKTKVDGLMATNTPPVAVAGTDVVGDTTAAIQFNGSGSYDPDGSIVSYDWDWDDATAHGTGPTPTHLYAADGVYTVTLTVTDNDGAQAQDTVQATVATAADPDHMNDLYVKTSGFVRVLDLNIPHDLKAPHPALGTVKDTSITAEELSTYKLVYNKKFSSVYDKIAAAQNTTTYPGSALKWFMVIAPAEYQGDADPYSNFAAGPQFRQTGLTTDPSIEQVFGGHWLYKETTPIAQYVNNLEPAGGTMTIYVQDASVIELDEFAAIFIPTTFADCEHVYVIGRNTSVTPNTVTIGIPPLESAVRNYKGWPTIPAHTVGSGAVMASHQRGNVATDSFWSRNLTEVCPLDGNGLRFNQILADWIAENMWANPGGTGDIRSDVYLSGVGADSDFSILQDGTISGQTRNIDSIPGDAYLDADWGYNPADGTPWWTNGLEWYYERLLTQLHTYTGDPAGRTRYEMGNMGGDGKMFGIAGTIGTQIEAAMDSAYGEPALPGQFNVNQIYRQFSTVKLHAHAHDYGPLVSDMQSKLVSAIYPAGTGTTTGNNYIRLNMGTAACFGHHHSTQNNADTDPWYDEYAVYTSGGSYGQAVAKTNFADRRANSSWLGLPLGQPRRVYADHADFDWSENTWPNPIFENTLASTTPAWSGSNCTFIRDTSVFYTQAPTAARASIRATPGWPQSQPNDTDGAVLTGGPTLDLTSNVAHVVGFAVRSLVPRKMEVNIGWFTSNPYYIPPGWSKHVIATPITTMNSSHRISFEIGSAGANPIWFDQLFYTASTVNCEVFEREFENGKVVVNMSRRTATNIPLNGTYNRILGTQDSAHNNGATGITTVTLAAHDAIFLIKPQA